MSVLRIALVGAGNRGRWYWRRLREIGIDPVLVDPCPDGLVRMSEIAGAPVTALESVDALGPIDGAIVATPPQVRGAVVLPLVQRDVPVLVEKPISRTPGLEANELEPERQWRSGVEAGADMPLVRVSMQFRQSPPFRHLAAVLAGQRLVACQTWVHTTYRPAGALDAPPTPPGELFTEQGIHVLDAAHVLFGDACVEQARAHVCVGEDGRLIATAVAGLAGGRVLSHTHKAGCTSGSMGLRCFTARGSVVEADIRSGRVTGQVEGVAVDADLPHDQSETLRSWIDALENGVAPQCGASIREAALSQRLAMSLGGEG